MPTTLRPIVRPRRLPVLRFIRANLYDLLRLLRDSRVALTGFALVMLASTAYIKWNYPIGYAESLYESFRLLTLQSSLVFPSNLLGIALFMLVPVLGLALILDSVFRFGRLLLDKSTRVEAWQVALASTYQGHVIVCGLGRVGLRLVTQLLATGHEVVVIEREWNGEFVQRALELRVPVVLGDARELGVLRQAGVNRAHAMLVAIAGDMINIEVALNVRRERPGLRVIMRVFLEDLDRNLEETFGRRTIFSASALAAPTFAAAAVSREVSYMLPLEHEALGLTELVVASESLMSGFARKIEEDYDIRIVQHHDATGKLLPPAAMRQLDTGDRVTLIGSLGALETVRTKNVPKSKAHAALGMLPIQRPTAQLNRVIVCGLGKVGYRVVQQLLRMPDHPAISVIHLPDTRPEFLHQFSRIESVTLIEGDARSPDVQAAAGLAEAYSVAALTSDDFVNLQIGLVARRQRKNVHLVMRMFSDVLAEQLEDLFAIRTVYSTSALAAPTMAAAAVLGDVTSAFFSGSALFSTDTSQIQPGGVLEGLMVEQVRERYSALVIGLRRGGAQHTLPDYAASLHAGDEVVLLAQLADLARLRGVIEASEASPAALPGGARAA
ncbi:MAG: potassium channel protein [Roseiflexaceae bacterium]|nr:potassium channel protein [Roseiflexaceae bacterium]